MKRLLVVAASAAVLVVAGASGAFAGEVKGPPNQVDNTNVTGALDHANSACAASGLNSWKFYGFQPGDVGTLGLCQGGTGEA